MTIPNSLIAAIRAFPDEDGPRVGLAEWYEARGDLRADFIRAQLEQATLSARLDDLSTEELTRLDSLDEKQARLLEEHESSWLEEWGLVEQEVRWRRGVPADLVLSWSRFAEAGEAALEIAPIVNLRLQGEALDLAGLFGSPSLMGLSGLDLSRSRFREDQLDPLIDGLLDSAVTEHLVRLDLSGIALQHLRIKRLAPLEAPRLRELRLASTKLGTTGAAALADAPFFERLATLDVSGNRLGAAGVRPILRSAGMQSIGTLHLDDNLIGEEGAHEMVMAPPMKALHTLTLSGNQLGADGTQALLPNLSGIRVLDLSFNALGAGGVSSIPSSRRLDALVDLDLSYNDVRAEGVRLFLQSPRLPSLRRLDLSGNGLSLRALEYLTRSTLLGRLHRLGLASNHLLDRGIETLARSNQVGALRELDLQNNGITWRGVEAMVDSKHFSRLWRVLLEENSLEPRGDALLQARFPHARRSRVGMRGALA